MIGETFSGEIKKGLVIPFILDDFRLSIAIDFSFLI